MRESKIEGYFRLVVLGLGGKSYKFVSPGNSGVSDRIACLPGGVTWFVELKSEGGKLRPGQKVFEDEMERLGQNHCVLKSIEQVNQWRELCMKKQ